MPHEHVVSFSLALFHTGRAAQAEQLLRNLVNDYVRHRQEQGEEQKTHQRRRAKRTTAR